MPRPLAVLERKVLYKNRDPKTQVSAKISIPRWWVGDADYVVLKVYEDKIVVTKKEG